jgi:hypothetical protein
LHISSVGVFEELEQHGEEPRKRPQKKHDWGKALELDFRRPANETGSADANSVRSDKITAPTPSP